MVVAQAKADVGDGRGSACRHADTRSGDIAGEFFG